VLPLSNAGRGPFVLPVVINGVLIHMFGVGLPAALFARAIRITNPESLIPNHQSRITNPESLIR
jgi:hypothetical protein